MEISEEFLQLKDDHKRKKVKDKGVIPGTPANDASPKKEKIENLCCAEIKEGVETCIKLILQKLARVHENE